jgi:outer membrane protein OmpA-like peptidoglycan-associated protein
MNRFQGGILLFTFLFCSFTSAFTQQLSKKEFIRAVQNADISFYYDEDYEKAASAYESLLKIYPENVNLVAKLGICYLNIDGKNQEALALLKRASTNIVEKEKDYVEYGEKAPLDTYLYLAVAYLVNDSLEKALNLFYDAKKRLANTDLFREDYLDNQIRDCRYAMEMKKKPLTIISDLFVPWLKDYPGACNPVLAKNDSVFIFTQKKDEKTRIYCSYKSDKWKTPVDITKQLGNYDRFYSNSITGDGKLLVLYMDDGDDGNLYLSYRKDSVWTKIKSIGKPINTIYWESDGFITPDGKKLFFSSNRPGGAGELDIWVSDRKNDGSWEYPVNCGEVINTPFNEDTPFFDPVTSSLLFSSVGHISMGGYDVFRSVFRNGGWTNPVGMPFAFNTTDKNLFFILNNNAPGFVTSIYDKKTKERNIYSMVAIDPEDEITTTEGTVALSDGMEVEPGKATVKLTDAKKNTLIQTVPVKEDGSFKFEIKPGDYVVFVSHPGYVTDTINLSIPLYFLSHYMVINSSLIPDKVAEGSFLTIKNILFAFDSYKLDAEAKSALESIRSILINYPDLKIEVAGYTDSKGPAAYNIKLADKRAKAVVNYLVSAAIPESRFVKKAFGESNFVAVNTNRDGSDNPEGRKYNRRVAFGIVDPHTGVIIRQDNFTPEHLRYAGSMKYSIVLRKSAQRLSPGYFDNLDLNGKLFVKTVETDSLWLYAIGIFYNKNDATKYLGYIKEKGINDAYIVNQYDLKNESQSRENVIPVVSQSTGKKIWTVQLTATRAPANMNIFSEFEGVREIEGEDGFYRYVSGEYTQFSKAKEALDAIKKAGFNDAFIRELNLLIIK